jgi:hypothetical protein
LSLALIVLILLLVLFILIIALVRYWVKGQNRSKSGREIAQGETKASDLDFGEVDRRYAKLKRQHEAGAITHEDFDTQLKQLMVQGPEGRWWAKSRKTGEWHYHDGTAWIKDTPPNSKGGDRVPRHDMRT